MEHPRPMLPSQRFSPSPVYGYDHQQHQHHPRHRQPNPRQPLRDSTGNAQHLGGGGGDLVPTVTSVPVATTATPSTCRAPSLGLFSPSLPASIPTPVVPSQAGAIYRGGGMGAGSLSARADTLRLPRRRYDINPIYHAPEFKPYREKQDQKDANEKQIWPRVLEDAFLDSLLTIPHMGRKKYSMQGKQFGRNMLISEYLWIAYCCSLQPGQKAEERKRKQVSSHIQVVKKMFEKHRCYHFFFVRDADKSEARLKETNTDMASFKDNPVLVALSEGRLPDVRPNYEYFSQILAMDSLVVMRPKTCWIFVSSSDVTMDEASGAAFDRSGKALDADDYPHLEKNLQKEADGGFARGLFRNGGGSGSGNGGSGSGVLLHEYNRELSQKESGAATEMAQEWEERFPSLHRGLEAATSENRWLDMLEMTVTLELHPRSNFPGGSELNGFVELSIGQPQLQNHRWKCLTRLQRPEELCGAGDEQSLLVEQTSEVGVQYTHRPGCSSGGDSSGDNNNKFNGGGRGPAGTFDCDCRSRPRQDVRVPFPAAEWASILSNCAGYLQEPLDQNKAKADGATSEEIKASEQAALESEQTASELIQQIAMLQELWSAPPDNGHSRERKWTRRGLILWKFRTIHAFDDKSNPIYEKPSPAPGRGGGRRPADVVLDGDEAGLSSSAASPSASSSSSSRPRRGSPRPRRMYHPPGTTWRFLTALDPISTEHQRNVCINPATNTTTTITNPHDSDNFNMLPSRDMVMAPSPHYSHHLTATMSENLNAAWDPAAPTMPGHLPSLNSTGPGSFSSVFGGYSPGLATPPPTASLHSSYPPSFDGNQDHGGHGQPGQQHQAQPPPPPQQHHHSHHQQLDFISPACTSSIDTQSTLVADTAVADPFLSATGGMNVSTSMGSLGSGVGVGGGSVSGSGSGSGYDEADFGPTQSWDTMNGAGVGVATSFGGTSFDQWNGWEEASSAPQPHDSKQWRVDNQRGAGTNHNLWATAADGGVKDVNSGSGSGQMWNQQPSWTQAVSAAAAAAVTGGADGRLSSLGWPENHQQQQQQRVLLPSLDQISPLKGLAGRKRGRSNSLDLENRENYPATVQKLDHGHGHGLANGVVGIPGMMEDGGVQGHHYRRE